MINKKLLLLSFGLLMTTQMIFSQVPSYVPSNGLVGYWPFNGNANDETPNGNNGTVNGASLTTDRFGNANSAYSFYGLNDFIEIQTSNGQFNSQNYSISFWYKTNQPGYSGFYPRAIISRTNLSNSPSNVYDNYCIFEGGGSTSLNYQGINTPFNSPSGCDWLNSVNDDIWHLLTVTVASNQINTYTDGILNLTSNSPPEINFQNYPIRLGKSIHNYWSEFNGLLDEISIYNRALSQQEITNMYNGVNYSDTCNAVSGSLTNGLVGYWPFCGNANDDSGNGNNGVVNGATLTTDRFGNSNGAYSFDGIDDYIRCLNSGVNGNSSRSFSFWLKSNSSLPGSLISYGNNDTPLEDFRIIQNGLGVCGQNGDISTVITGSGRGVQYNSSNNWDFFTVVYDSSLGTNMNYVKIYKNGILNTSYCDENTTVSINTGSVNPITFGCYHWLNYSGNKQFFSGSIDDIGIWNRALTQQEITQLYNQNQCITNITVTDTLIINVGQLSYTNPIAYSNNITIAPNPASTQININFNNISDLNGGSIKIINSLGQEVATTPITTSGTNTTMSLDTWGGTGLYFVQILNAQGIVVDVKKIILQ
jgi:hypothetical protein